MTAISLPNRADDHGGQMNARHGGLLLFLLRFQWFQVMLCCSPIHFQTKMLPGMLCFCKPLGGHCCGPEALLSLSFCLPVLRLAASLALLVLLLLSFAGPPCRQCQGLKFGVEAAIVPAICSVMFLMTVLNEGRRSHIPSLN